MICHGSEGGGGGEAPSLNRAVLSRAPDAALLSLITAGIETRMPATRHLSNTELHALVGYVRSLGRLATTAGKSTRPPRR